MDRLKYLEERVLKDSKRKEKWVAKQKNGGLVLIQGYVSQSAKDLLTEERRKTGKIFGELIDLAVKQAYGVKRDVSAVDIRKTPKTLEPVDIVDTVVDTVVDTQEQLKLGIDTEEWKNLAESEIHVMLNNLKSQGLSLSKMCREMENSKIFTLRGSETWNESTISKMIRRRAAKSKG